MISIAPLLLLVVGASAAPAAGGQSVLSIALDLLPELQAAMADAPEGSKADPKAVEGVTKAFSVFVPIIKKVMVSQAEFENTEVDPKLEKGLDRVGVIVPGVIRLLSAAFSGAPLVSKAEFALPDFTSLAVAAGDSPPVTNDVAMDAVATYAAPQQPAYAVPQNPTYAAPQQPAYVVPQAPTYAAPQEPTYTAPQEPTYAAPQEPAYTAPQESTYTAPQEPTYAAPQEPAYTAPQEPTYTVPAAVAPAAVVPGAITSSQFQFGPALEAARASGTQQTMGGVPSDGTVHYTLPGGGFFYSIGS